MDWIARARQSDILAEKYLFNFTALETLLSDGRKQNFPSITNNVSGYIAELLNSIIRIGNCKINSEQNKEAIWKFSKTLYGLRSKVVHAGLTKISIKEARTSQFFAELVIFGIILNYKDYLDKPQRDFFNCLDKSWILKTNKKILFLCKFKIWIKKFT